MTYTPFLNDLDTPFEAFPFDKIKSESFVPYIKAEITNAKNEIQDIIENDDTPTFENVIEAYEKSGRNLSLLNNLLSNLSSADTNPVLEKAREVIAPEMTKFHNDLLLNEPLFKKIKTIYDQKEALNLTTEQDRLLTQIYKGFTRNGILLNPNEKETLREIDKEIALLKIKFSQNVLKETNDYSLNLKDKKQIDALPDSLKDLAAKEAKKRREEGWTFTLQAPSYVPFMKLMPDRSLREKLYLAYNKRGLNKNASNNEPVIHELVKLRNQRAQLLGFKNHADFTLAERMAKDVTTVNNFLQDLVKRAYPFGKQDVAKLKVLAEKDGITEIMPWDHAYYAEQLKKQLFEIDDELLRPYFPLPQVLNAVFDEAGRLYHLTFKERTDIPKYHQDVQVFEVTENNQFKALLYTDFYARESKRPGAWMTDFIGQYKQDGKDHRPHISIVCNFTKPNGDQPSLLTFREVTTLFHEFGHSLHGMMANTTYESLSGTNVYWDFVELPSQFNENFARQKEFLKTFARHYQTGEVLPENLMEKVIESSNFMEGYQTMRQLSFGLLDMAYHTGQLKPEENIPEFEKTAMAPTKLYPKIEHTAMSGAFGHIFSGGYSAGYYSYKWSEVLEADAFSLFKEKGIFDPETAAKFKTLLSKGGTEDPMKLFIDFRGRAPKIDALMERAGLVEK